MLRQLFIAILGATYLTAQSGPPVTITIDTANVVVYRHDVFDGVRLATDQGRSTPLALRNFMPVTWLGDIVAVNGKPAKGVMTIRGTWLALGPSGMPGTGIADVINSLASDWMFDIQRADGARVGSILASGWTFGQAPPGLPSVTVGHLAVVGGTGAYLAVRGQGGMSADMGGLRAASVTEDPIARRNNGGGSRRYTLQLVPMVRPEVVVSAGEPQVFHEDFRRVTAAHPATKGEALIVAVAGLGPTVPGVDPGVAFPREGVQQVAAPVQVLVNGAGLDAINQIGWPGLVDTYRVDFRVPQDAAGNVSVQVVAAGIPGAAVQIPVQ